MKGNIAINKSIAKEIENGKIIQILLEVQFGGWMVPLFTPIPEEIKKPPKEKNKY